MGACCVVSGGGRGTIIPVCSVVLRPDPAKNTLVSNHKMTTIYCRGNVTLSGAPGARFAARMLTVRRLTGLHASIKESGARPKNRCINSNMHLTNISHARAVG